MNPAAYAQFAARIADDHLVLDHDRRAGEGLAALDVAQPGAPGQFAAYGIDRHGLVIENVVNDLAVGVGRAAIDHVTTGDTAGIFARAGVKRPFDGPCAGQVESNQLIRIRRNDVHRRADNQRLTLMAGLGAGWKGELLDQGVYIG